jgi:hypothetical protein
MAVRVELIYRWILTCRECHRALSYDSQDIHVSPSIDDHIDCPVCRTFNVVPSVGQRIPFQPNPIW